MGSDCAKPAVIMHSSISAYAAESHTPSVKKRKSPTLLTRTVTAEIVRQENPSVEYIS